MLSEATSDAITLSDLYLSRYPYCQGASANTLKGVGFKRLPLLHHSFLFEREGAAISLYRPPDKSHVQLRAGMRSADEFKLFQMLMVDHTSMKRP